MERLDEAGRQMDVGMPVARPRLQHADPGGEVLAQPVGKHAARGTGADDHIIERFHFACSFLSMILAENRYPLFRIMLVGASAPSRSTDSSGAPSPSAIPRR